jgi:hypothetical protein
MREAIRLCEHPSHRKGDEQKLHWLFDSPINPQIKNRRL